jgi:hypothetical protein
MTVKIEAVQLIDAFCKELEVELAAIETIADSHVLLVEAPTLVEHRRQAIRTRDRLQQIRAVLLQKVPD